MRGRRRRVESVQGRTGRVERSPVEAVVEFEIVSVMIHVESIIGVADELDLCPSPFIGQCRDKLAQHRILLVAANEVVGDLHLLRIRETMSPGPDLTHPIIAEMHAYTALRSRCPGD